MTIGGIAGMIAAIAFAVLVVFICLNLSKLAGVISDIQETVKRINTTIDVVTKDVDNLSIEVESLLNKGNTLVDDVNGKIKKTDPLFTAIGDLGVTVSELNASTTNLASNLLNNTGKKWRNPLNNFMSVLPTKDSRNSSDSEDVTRPVETAQRPQVKEDSSTHQKPRRRSSNRRTREEDQAVQSLKQFINAKPSTTAGEITIKS